MSFLNYNVELCASVVFISALCDDVRLAASVGRYLEDLRTCSRNPGHLKYPWASHTLGHLFPGYQQSGCLRWEGCLRERVVAVGPIAGPCPLREVSAVLVNAVK